MDTRWFQTSTLVNLIRRRLSTLTQMASKCKRECRTTDQLGHWKLPKKSLTTTIQSTRPSLSRMPSPREGWLLWMIDLKAAPQLPQELLNSCRIVRHQVTTARELVSHFKRRTNMVTELESKLLTMYKSATVSTGSQFRDLLSTRSTTKPTTSSISTVLSIRLS